MINPASIGALENLDIVFLESIKIHQPDETSLSLRDIIEDTYDDIQLDVEFAL